MILTLIVICFGVGALLGFIGAGGAGVMVSLPTIGFGFPIHEAVGTALAAMFFVSVSGAYSHYREGNVNVRAGLIVGATLGAGLSNRVPEHILQPAAGYALWFLALLVWLRTRLVRSVPTTFDLIESSQSTNQILGASALGITGGVASAFFGVGMAPFIQQGLLTIVRLPLTKTIGTTMLALVFISSSGSIAVARQIDVSLPHLIGATIGMTAGSFLGARWTRREPLPLLRWAIVQTPFVAGALLIFR